ncbi:MAG: helix-turn-helix transcriptional regulator [Rhodanobacteraceae bacterium]|nr:helix-turn-helix transcriptional regulator [Rhodanobacteraceae bacterium]
MNANPEVLDLDIADFANCLAEQARARILCCLMDGRGRTATELAAVAEVGSSTTSAHLAMLSAHGLVHCLAQGRYRYYSLASAEVATVVESLLVLSDRHRPTFTPRTPVHLRESRRCYDHLAGCWAVRLHDHAVASGWITVAGAQGTNYAISAVGESALQALGVDMTKLKSVKRRQLAKPCMDWSERRPHLAGALGAAMLEAFLRQNWFTADLDSRALRPTRSGLLKLGALLDR